MGVPPCFVSIHRCFWDFGLVGELGVRCGFGRVERLTSLDYWPGLRGVHYGRAFVVFIIHGIDVVGLLRLLRGGDCILHVAGLSVSLLTGAARSCKVAEIALPAAGAALLFLFRFLGAFPLGVPLMPSVSSSPPMVQM